ncbi:MAG: hypothetical protein ABI840_05085, partial [bacterium]
MNVLFQNLSIVVAQNIFNGGVPSLIAVKCFVLPLVNSKKYFSYIQLMTKIPVAFEINDKPYTGHLD